MIIVIIISNSSSKIFKTLLVRICPWSIIPGDTRRRFNVYRTSIRRRRRRIDVETTLCIYWDATNSFYCFGTNSDKVYTVACFCYWTRVKTEQCKVFIRAHFWGIFMVEGTVTGENFKCKDVLIEKDDHIPRRSYFSKWISNN